MPETLTEQIDEEAIDNLLAAFFERHSRRSGSGPLPDRVRNHDVQHSLNLLCQPGNIDRAWTRLPSFAAFVPLSGSFRDAFRQRVVDLATAAMNAPATQACAIKLCQLSNHVTPKRVSNTAAMLSLFFALANAALEEIRNDFLGLNTAHDDSPLTSALKLAEELPEVAPPATDGQTVPLSRGEQWEKELNARAGSTAGNIPVA